MPAFVGAVNVVSVGGASVFHIGDVYTISPYSEAKTYAGAGSFNTGDGLRVYNQQSWTNTDDKDTADQNIIANA